VSQETAPPEGQEESTAQVDERDLQLRELKEELTRLSEDYSALSSAKS